MAYYTRLYMWSRAGHTHILGLNRIGWLILAAILSSGIWIAIGGVVSVAGWQWTSAFLAILFISLLFGFGFYVRIGRGRFRLYEISFFVPIPRISVPLNQVKINWTDLDYPHDPRFTYIYKSDDWTDMEESDWIEIAYKSKEYQIGSKSNIRDLYRHLKDAIETESDSHRTHS